MRGNMSALMPERDANADKFACGRALLVCGSELYPGAPFFAAQAAVNSGCGLTYLSVPECAYTAVFAKLCEPVYTPRADVIKRLSGCDAVLIGPGLGREFDVSELVESSVVATVLDADALTCVSRDMSLLKNAHSPLILTPHEGEFSRLCPSFDGSNREDAARAFAHKYGCVLVLKGANTVVAAPNEPIYVNTTGNAGMACGGSGDVLAGIIVSLAAQGLSPFNAARLGVFVHGLAGDMAQSVHGTLGMTPTDTLFYIKKALSVLENDEQI
ncbi:MAG: NAD(P)H-hydrate dehydratase [Clostridia bacterium]